jgi:ribosome-binding factor A
VSNSVVSKERTQRIAERIREELSEMLIQEVADPRVSGISITDVKVDRELNYADIYYSALEGSSRAEEILDGLQHAQGFLRSQLAGRINLRTFPRLRFHWDPTFERAERMEQLFASLQAEREAKEASQTPNEADPPVESEREGDIDG